MDPMMELVNALNALTAALQKFTSQTTNAYLDTFEEIYDPEKDELQAAEAPKNSRHRSMKKRLSPSCSSAAACRRSAVRDTRRRSRS